MAEKVTKKTEKAVKAEKVKIKEKAVKVEKAVEKTAVKTAAKTTAKPATKLEEPKAPSAQPAQHRKEKKLSPEVIVHVSASFNNTIVTITDLHGNVLSSSSPGLVGFKGTKKSTAFGATKAAEDAVNKAQKYGIREAKVYIKGPGSGRNAAVKGLDAAGLRITLLSDITPLPHNGCRPRKLPRK